LHFTFSIDTRLLKIKGQFQIQKENYDQVAKALKEILDQIKHTKNIQINDENYNIEYSLGCDYKMLLILFGKKSASADDACMYCNVHLRDPPDVDAKWPIFRKLSDIPDNLDPIINFIDYENVVFDSLHCLLRVSDSFYKLLLMKLAQMDNDSISTELDDRPNLKIFIEFLIHTCKITNPYFISEKSEEKISFRHFTGNERMRIFKELFKETDQLNDEGEKKTLSMQRLYPNILSNLYDFKYEDYVWSNFYKIYLKIKNFAVKPFDPKILEAKLKKWLKAYLKIRKVNRNIERLDVYPHLFVFHLVELMEMHNGIHAWNTQNLEKLNGFCIKYYHQCTNKNNKNLKYLSQLIKKRNRIEFITSKGEFNDFEHDDEDDDYDYFDFFDDSDLDSESDFDSDGTSESSNSDSD